MKAKILIIDDSKTIRFQVRKILESEEENQFEILEAEDGVSALENVVRLEKDSLPDLILLDRNMPRMNGDEFIRIFKNDPTWKHIPVLFLTTHGEIEELVRGLTELQAEDYLGKPFNPSELMARVKSLLRVRFAEKETLSLNSQLSDSLEKQKQQYEELKQTRIELAETAAVASMTRVFEKFVPREFLDRIAKTGIENISLGHAESDIITILFSDIRSFTDLSETMTPDELMKFLNSYLKFMSEPIRINHGFVDKFIGDAIMALFDHPEKEDSDEARDAAAKSIPAIYPEGTGTGKTRAKAEIWTEREAFIAVADEMAKAAENLIRIAESGELREFSQALRPLGKSCKDCHDQFRKRR